MSEIIHIPEWLAILLYLHGIALGLFAGWMLWRRQFLQYEDKS